MDAVHVAGVPKIVLHQSFFFTELFSSTLRLNNYFKPDLLYSAFNSNTRCRLTAYLTTQCCRPTTFQSVML